MNLKDASQNKIDMIDLRINFISSVPIHYQVRAKVLSGIKVGAFPMGSTLPSTLSLSKRFGVAVIFVDRAYRQLIKEKVLVYEKERGFIVSDATACRIAEDHHLNSNNL